MAKTRILIMEVDSCGNCPLCRSDNVCALSMEEANIKRCALQYTKNVAPDLAIMDIPEVLNSSEYAHLWGG